MPLAEADGGRARVLKLEHHYEVEAVENTLIRSERCPDCGEEMLWTQNVWPLDSHADAAFRCHNGHVSDPATTKQCPACGVHDTRRVEEVPGTSAAFKCYRCATRFTVPR